MLFLSDFLLLSKWNILPKYNECLFSSYKAECIYSQHEKLILWIFQKSREAMQVTFVKYKHI